jgi:hypothetical protein
MADKEIVVEHAKGKGSGALRRVTARVFTVDPNSPGPQTFVNVQFEPSRNGAGTSQSAHTAATSTHATAASKF